MQHASQPRTDAKPFISINLDAIVNAFICDERHPVTDNLAKRTADAIAEYHAQLCAGLSVAKREPVARADRHAEPGAKCYLGSTHAPGSVDYCSHCGAYRRAVSDAEHLSDAESYARGYADAIAHAERAVDDSGAKLYANGHADGYRDGLADGYALAEAELDALATETFTFTQRDTIRLARYYLANARRERLEQAAARKAKARPEQRDDACDLRQDDSAGTAVRRDH